MFKTQIEKALKIISFLDDRDGELATRADIGKAIQVSTRNVETVVRPLMNAGILLSHRGPFGGYETSKIDLTIGKLADILGYSTSSFGKPFLDTDVREIIK